MNACEIDGDGDVDNGHGRKKWRARGMDKRVEMWAEPESSIVVKIKSRTTIFMQQLHEKPLNGVAIFATYQHNLTIHFVQYNLYNESVAHHRNAREQIVTKTREREKITHFQITA